MGEFEKESSEWDSLVWIVIIALVGVFVFIALPSFIKARSTSSQNACINNLRQIEAAKNEWALENSKTNGVVATENDIKPYIKLDSKGNIPKCPQGGTYTIGKVGENPTCSLGTTVAPAHVLP
jgi:general secretion pathway protein G